MSTLVITETEIQRRKKLAEQAMELIKSCLPWESEEPNTIMTSYKGFYLQISISDVHPLIVFCFVTLPFPIGNNAQEYNTGT